jgi:DNA polymerase I
MSDAQQAIDFSAPPADPASAKPKLVLIDGMALAYRGHFALINNPRLTSGGMNTSAVHVFANTLLDLMTTCAPTHFAVAFDTPEPTQRHKDFPAYKEQREEMPEALREAFPWIDKLCAAFRIPVLRLPGWEADDIIGTLAARAEATGMDVLMVTPDKDFAQLVSDRCRLYRPKRGGGYEELGPAEVCAQWEVSRVAQVIDVLGLMGDASDNIPGVPGYGEKTAKKMIADFGSIEALLARSAELKGKKREALEANRELALLCKKLVTIDRAAPVPEALESLVRQPRDDAAVRALFEQLEFRTLGQRLLGSDFELSGGKADEPATIRDTFHSYRIVEGAAARQVLVKELLAQRSVCFDLETDGLEVRRCLPIGIALSWREHAGAYVPLPADAAGVAAVLAEFAPFWLAEGIEKIGHNLKFDLGVLHARGTRVRGPFFDTMLAAWLVLPESRRGMDDLSVQLLHYRPVPIEDLIGPKGPEQKSMRDVPLAQVAEYAAEDADVTFQLAGVLRPLLAEQGAEQVFRAVESPLTSVLVTMEGHGIRLDAAVLAQLGAELQRGIDADRAKVFELAGGEFNLNSPKQLGEVLFDRMALMAKPPKTATGQYKTDEQVLSRLAAKHEIAARILSYRTRTKLKGTYVDALPESIDPVTGRVHTHFDQAVAATGRLASHDPNLQNIPIRSEQGREIRAAFVPGGPEFRLLSADYSQVELRLAAAMSGDPAMIAAFAAGQDIHAATAARIHGVAVELVDEDMRRGAKTVNFGILYGITAFGLAERMGIPRGEGQDLIDSYYAAFPRLRTWLDEIVEGARKNGWVETLTGRRRLIRDIASTNATVRAAAERLAINSPLQGSAADLIKLAMVRIQDLLERQERKSRMLLQVHDELVFELHRDDEADLPVLIRAAMMTALPLPNAVPLEVEMGIGANWLEAH